MRSKLLALAVAATAAAFGAGAAGADTMHPELGARLAGMGVHGIVNFQSQLAKSRLCWTFELPASGWTAATIRDAHGMVVVRLGTAFKAKSCAAVAARALRLLETKPGAYRVWVDTKGHPGDVRGTLVSGMVHM
jgi:hypothetical protein